VLVGSDARLVRSCDRNLHYSTESSRTRDIAVTRRFPFTFEHGVPTGTRAVPLVDDSGIILPEIIQGRDLQWRDRQGS